MADLIEKMDVIQKRLGGAGKAAKAVGVTLTSWGRWRTEKDKKRVTPSRQSALLIDMIYKQLMDKSA